MSKLAMKATTPQHGTTQATSLRRDGELVEQQRKRLQQRPLSPYAECRRQQSRTQIEDNYRPTEEQAREDQQAGSVVLVKMIKEQAPLVKHVCMPEPNLVYDCPGLQPVRAMLVNRARADGLSPAGADDLAQQCFVSALEAKADIKCLAKWASHKRRFRWEILDGATTRDRWRRNVQKWGQALMAETPSFGKSWTSYHHHRGPGEAVGEWSVEGPEAGCADRRWDDIQLVVTHSPRNATKTACLQMAWGKPALRAAGIQPLTDQRLGDEKAAIRRDYNKLLHMGEVRYAAEMRLFRQGN
jgi:hypothetical protein